MRGEFADDNLLPLLTWYGIEPAVTRQPKEAIRLAMQTKFPKVREFIARRLTLEIDEQGDPVSELISQMLRSEVTTAMQADVLRGMSEALRGRSRATAPPTWPKLANVIAETGTKELVSLSRELSVAFGDGRAADELKKLVMNGREDVSSRQQALRTLVTAKSDDVATLLLKLLDDREMIVEAIRGLSNVDHAEAPKRIIDRLARLTPEEKAIAISTLVSRSNYAREMLSAVASDKLSRRDISAYHARQILSFGNDELMKQLTAVWGEVRTTSAEKHQLTAAWKEKLNPSGLKDAHPGNGRAIFNKSCANCHVLFGSGKTVGPDLTGGNRRNLDYLLENILDPSATVAADFRMTTYTMADGRVINGVVVEKTGKTLTVQTPTDRVTIQNSDIDEQKQSTLSLMPDGLLQNLTDDQVRELIAYLMSPDQVPLSLPETRQH